MSELDRLLSTLSRPVRVGARVPKTVRAEMTGLGLEIGRAACRRELIELLWERKRPLIRQFRQVDDPPLPPCA